MSPTPLRFITGSANKFAEAAAIIPDLVRAEADLPEIQSLDPEQIICAKLDEAARSFEGRLIVEDTCLFFDCLGSSLPGPLIKWFLKPLGPQGLFELADRYGVHGATARCTVGLKDGDRIRFFVGEVRGAIVAPAGETAFGWDPIFKPEWSDRTFAELSTEEKNADSHRARAFKALASHLST